MRILVPAILVALLFSNAFSQNTIKATLDRFNDGSVPYITVAQLKSQEHLVLLDTREEEEFAISRIPGATWVGYDTFITEKVVTNIPDKTTPIVVYCSVGVRSENIGERLQKAGYTQVKKSLWGNFSMEE